MTISAGSSYKMSREKGKTPGWAAFDLKQRQKQGLGPKIDVDPFPPITTTTAQNPSEKLIGKIGFSVRPFSSVLLPSNDFSALRGHGDFQKEIKVGDSCRKIGDYPLKENVEDSALQKLKERHNWADDSLLCDIIAAVDNDVVKVSSVLNGMASTVNFDESTESSIIGLDSTSENISSERKSHESSCPDKVIDLSSLSSTLDSSLKVNDRELVDGNYSHGEKGLDSSNLRLNVGNFSSIPIEPEWEDDVEDIYTRHRKDALRNMRSASKHSRAATSAFLRGDHITAQEHSMKAQDKWYVAEKLNEKAAKEILSIRNRENDLWKLDLHGLHASEATQVLQHHLHKIEQFLSNHYKSSYRLEEKDELLHYTSPGSLCCLDSKKLEKKHLASGTRLSLLEVITGIGNHSRGQAALPTAVKSFLCEKRYRHEEFRPGVIRVWPKFRQR